MQSVIFFVEKNMCTHTYTHACTHQCHILDFTKFTAEEVYSRTQAVLNILEKNLPINESSVNFKFNFIKIKF